jgi:hypothetical protein
VTQERSAEVVSHPVVRVTIALFIGMVVLVAGCTSTDGHALLGAIGAAADYPPPPPTATSSPTPDANGLFPPATGITTTETTINTSDFPLLLARLHDDLQNGDAEALASYMGSQIKVASATSVNAAAMLTEGEAKTVLEGFFVENESSPVLQGYFVWQQGGMTCAILLTASWTGDVELEKAYGFGGLSGIRGEAFRWDVCESPRVSGEPVISGWMFGPYYAMLNLTAATRKPAVYKRILP